MAPESREAVARGPHGPRTETWGSRSPELRSRRPWLSLQGSTTQSSGCKRKCTGWSPERAGGQGWEGACLRLSAPLPPLLSTQVTRALRWLQAPVFPRHSLSSLFLPPSYLHPCCASPPPQDGLSPALKTPHPTSPPAPCRPSECPPQREWGPVCAPHFGKGGDPGTWVTPVCLSDHAWNRGGMLSHEARSDSLGHLPSTPEKPARLEIYVH